MKNLYAVTGKGDSEFIDTHWFIYISLPDTKPFTNQGHSVHAFQSCRSSYLWFLFYVKNDNTSAHSGVEIIFWVFLA